MLRVYSKYKQNPPHSYGDCWAACLSSVLESDVPHVLIDNCASRESRQRLDDFLMPLGLAYFECAVFRDSVMDALLWGEEFTRPHFIHYLLSGVTRRGGGHSVVCKDKRIVHNPTFDAEIIGPHEGGEFWIGVLAKRL